MIQSIQLSFKTILRRKPFIFAYALLIIITNALLLSLLSPNQSAAEFLSDTMRLGQLGISCFIFLGYELFSILTCEENIELISTTENAVERLVLAQLISLFVFIIVWSINLYIWQVGGFIFFSLTYLPFLFHALLSVILNCITPACIGSLLGAFLALSVKRTKAYCLMLVFLLFSSNIPPQVFASEEIAGFPILEIFDWFALLVLCKS